MENVLVGRFLTEKYYVCTLSVDLPSDITILKSLTLIADCTYCNVLSRQCLQEKFNPKSPEMHSGPLWHKADDKGKDRTVQRTHSEMTVDETQMKAVQLIY